MVREGSGGVALRVGVEIVDIGPVGDEYALWNAVGDVIDSEDATTPGRLRERGLVSVGGEDTSGDAGDELGGFP